MNIVRKNNKATAEISNKATRVISLANSMTVQSLNNIDVIIDWLVSVSDASLNVKNILVAMTDQISSRKFATYEYFDEDDLLINMLEWIAIALRSDTLPRIIGLKKSIDQSREFRHHQREMQETCIRTIESIENLIELVDSVRSTIITQDLAAEPRGVNAFDKVEYLIAELNKGICAMRSYRKKLRKTKATRINLNLFLSHWKYMMRSAI